MRTKAKKYSEILPYEFLILREKFGLKRYRKTSKRDPKEREILLRLALNKIKEKEKEDFSPIGYRRRRLRI